MQNGAAPVILDAPGDRKYTSAVNPRRKRPRAVHRRAMEIQLTRMTLDLESSPCAAKPSTASTTTTGARHKLSW